MWKECFAAVPLSADYAEEAVKALAGLRGQQRQNDDIASRFLRCKLNPHRSVLPAAMPERWDLADSIWSTLVPEHKKRPRELRMRNFSGQSDDIALPPLTAAKRTRYNAALRYNAKYSEEEKESRAQPPAPTSSAELAATQQLCARHFVKADVAPEPELAPDGRVKKRCRKTTKKKSGKDEKDD